MTETTRVEAPLTERRMAVAVVTAGFGQNFVLTTVSTFLLLYLLQYAQVSAAGMAVVTVVITAAKVLDAITDPVMGSIIDLTRTRWGKLRPYVLFSALPVAVLSGLLFSVPAVDEPVQLLYFAVVYVLWGLAYTVCDVPFWGLIGSAFARPDARARVIGNVRAFGAIALGAATLGMPWIALALSGGGETTGAGWTAAVFLTSLIGMGMFLLAFFFTRERPSAAASPRLPLRQLVSAFVGNRPLLVVLVGSVLGFGRYLVQAGGAVFVVIAYDDEGAFSLVGAAIIAGMVIASFLTPLALRRASARSLMIGSSLVGAVAYLGLYLVGFAQLGVLLGFIFVSGLSLGVFLVTQATMIADSVDDLERRTGIRNDGISFASLTFVSKIMNALAVAAFGTVIVLVGYDAGAVVTPQLQQSVFAAITLLPAVSCLLSAVPFAWYRLGSRAPGDSA